MAEDYTIGEVLAFAWSHRLRPLFGRGRTANLGPPSNCIDRLFFLERVESSNFGGDRLCCRVLPIVSVS